ncbi:MAG: dienelactone hydrolase family protein [Acidobacteriota bacterium]
MRTDDGTCPVHAFHPDGGGPWPGVVMYIDGIGMRPAMLAIGERLAAAGYYVLVPDLFYRAGAYTAPDPKALFADEAVRHAWFKLAFAHVSPEKTMRDTRAFLDRLAATRSVRAGKVGVFGYCMGGRMALTAAGTFPERIACVAAYHPGGLATDAPDSPHLLAPRIRARVYIAAATEDQTFPEEQQQRLEKALADANVDHVMETYPARHGWVPSDTPVHDAVQAERHWQTLTDLLARSLV